jgi:phosphatidylglycerol:prolipoprotein diacylglycerol transferase
VLPYVELPALAVGPWHIEPFGLLVIIGCVVGYGVAVRYAADHGLERLEVRRLALWVLVPAFVVSEWLALLFYYPGTLAREPLRYLVIGQNMFSYGGFLGAGLGAAAYWRGRRQSFRPYADALVAGLTVGWFFGRLGCALVHDHPGLPSDFVLAVRFPDGSRHDLGLYEWILTALLVGMVLGLWRRALPAGTLAGLVGLGYAPIRFLLDFLRSDEARYAGLTPAQYLSVALAAASIWLLLARRRGSPPSPPVAQRFTT